MEKSPLQFTETDLESVRHFTVYTTRVRRWV